MKKKKLTTLLALVLTVCMVTACGSKPATELESKTDASTVETQKSEPAKEEAAESQYPDYLNLDGYRPIVKEGEEITLKIGVLKNPVAECKMDDVWMTHFIEEVLNINIEYLEIPLLEMAEKKNLMLTSGDLPDIMIMLGVDPMKYGVEEGMLMPISDYLSEELTPNIIAHLDSNPAAKAASTMEDGKIYGTTQLEPADFGFGPTVPSGYRYHVDTNYLEAAGYESVPEDIDGFVDMLREFKKVGDKMGVDEVWPLLAGEVYQIFFEAYGWMGEGINAIDPVWDVEEGKVVVPASQEKYQDYIKLLNTLYTEELIHPDFMTLDAQAMDALESERKGGIIREDSVGNVFTEKENGWGDFSAVAPLKSEHNPEGYVKATPNYYTSHIQISADTEYPELCLRLVDWLCSTEGKVYNAIGAPVGSEDTLGLIDGFTILDDGTIDFGTADDNYKSPTYYKINNINLAYQYVVLDSLLTEAACELVGVPYQTRVCDLENPLEASYYNFATVCKGKLLTAMPEVSLPSESAARFSDLKTVLSDYLAAETAKFIVGQRPLDELSKLQEELKAIGLEEYIEMCEDLYANYAGPSLIEYE